MRERRGVRVLVADDHPLFRLGLAAALRELGFGAVDEAEDGQHACDLARGREYDVIVLDVRMPRMNGVEAARQIIAACEARQRPIAIVMLSTFDEPAILRAARSAGARAFLGKEVQPDALARTIDELLARPGSTFRELDVPLPPLSARETQVLSLISRGSTNREVADVLGVSPETVKDHVTSLFRKLNVNDRMSAVNEARRLGLLAINEIVDPG